MFHPLAVSLCMGGNNQITDLEELLQHAGWVRNLANASLQDFALAEDISQEVLLKALAGPRRTGKILRAWLAAVTRNMAKNELRGTTRRRAREEEGALKDEAALNPGQDEIFESHRKIANAVEALSPKSRQIIVLRFYKQSSFKEIAAELSITSSNARVRLHRALRELRESLEVADGDWRVSCAMVLGLPMHDAISSTALGLGIKSEVAKIDQPALRGVLSGMGIIGLIVGISWIAFGWEGAVSHFDPNLLAEAEPLEAVSRTHLKSANHDLNRRSVPIENSVEHAPDSTGVFVQRNGRVFHDGYPVAAAEIKSWQNGKFQNTMTDGDGFFQLKMNLQDPGSIAAFSGGMARMISHRPEGNSPIIINLLKPESNGVRIQVYDGNHRELLPDADVKVFIDWAGGSWGLHPRENAFELISQGRTNAQGYILAPGWLVDMRLAVSGLAEGFLPNMEYNYQAVSLYRGGNLPIQFVYPDGTPVADIELRQGRLVHKIERTDENGFMPEVDQWNEATATDEVEALPIEMCLRLPDGRIWRHDCYSISNDLIAVLEDRIQITVDLTPVLAELGHIVLSAGNWIEMRSVNKGFPSLIPADPDALWQKLEMGKVAKLDQSWLGNTRQVQARMMPGRIQIGEYPVKEGKAVIRRRMIHFELTAEGRAVERGEQLLVVLKGVLKTEEIRILLQDGIAEKDLPWHDQYTAWVESVKSGERCYLDDDGKSISTVAYLNSDGDNLQAHFKLLDTHFAKVHIKVDGLPVLGGRINTSAIDLNGNCEIPLDANGHPLLSDLKLIYPGELQCQSGGVILSEFSFQKDTRIPGELREISTGSWVWDLDLAHVELLLPPMQGQKPLPIRGVYYSELGNLTSFNTSVNWPIVRYRHRSSTLHAPALGGPFSFRVIPGRYAFRVGDQYSFGTENGVDLIGGELNSLEPNVIRH